MATTTTPSPVAAAQSVQGDAAILEAPRQAAMHPRTYPPPQPGQVRVRLEGCGVCGSNVPVWEGRPWFDYPRQPGSPGHEGWGVIDAVGEGVEQFAVGDDVALLSYAAFASYDFAPAEQVVAVPNTLAGQPFPGEAVGCAVNVVRRCQLQTGESVAVVGLGFLGALVVQLAVAAGARVVAISRRSDSLAVAQQFGAHPVLAAGGSEGASSLSPEVDRESFGCVIEATGFQQPLDLAASLVKTRGRLVIGGYHQDGLRTVNMQSWNWRGIDVINAHERDPRAYVQGMREGIAAVQSGQLNLAPLLTHELPLAQLGQALELASTRPEGFIKAWVRCR